MDDLLKRQYAEELENNVWFKEVISDTLANLNNRLCAGQIESTNDIVEASIASRTIKQLQQQLLEPLQQDDTQ